MTAQLPRSAPVAATRWRRWIVAATIALPLLAAMLYLLNPSGTASLDPRARVFGYVTFRVASMAMSPTLEPGDLVWVNAWSYRDRVPDAGDVVVYYPPHSPDEPWIARVAGIAGDRVAIREGVLYVNDRSIAEPYVDSRALTQQPSLAFAEIVVPADGMFVLGDNRDNSHDSRYWGSVSSDRLVGRVLYRYRITGSGIERVN
jgi:signal peptidase I